MVTVTATGMAMPRETVKVSRNIYKPYLMTIVDMRDETHDTRTLRLQFKDPEVAQTFDWKPGQFAQYSVFGVGECVFTIANSPTRKVYIECTFPPSGQGDECFAGHGNRSNYRLSRSLRQLVPR
jgi:predicted ferric reductase